MAWCASHFAACLLDAQILRPKRMDRCNPKQHSHRCPSWPSSQLRQDEYILLAKQAWISGQPRLYLSMHARQGFCKARLDTSAMQSLYM